MNRKTMTQEEMNTLAEKDMVANRFEYCLTLHGECMHLMDEYSIKRDETFYVCGYFKEILNGTVRCESCFDTFGVQEKDGD